MIRLFEMFAGYGGASWALKKAKIEFESVGFSDIKKSSIKCYQQNFPGVKNYGDCSKIESNELPDFDLLTGGFPCQDVSVCGKRDLSIGRTNLYSEILRIISVKKPKYLLLENVKGLTTMVTENGLFLHTKIIKDLKKVGYSVIWGLLNSKDYGTPQNRERIWFVCKLGSWDFMEFQFPIKIPLKLSVSDLLIENRQNREIKNKRIDSILKHPVINKENLVYELVNDTPSGISRQADRIYSTKYAPCLNTVQREYLFYHKGRVIKLEPRECFRLMGFFDDEINLEGLSDNQIYDLAGDGWDINVASKIFRNMFKQMKGGENH